MRSSASVLADSITADGQRLTTLQVRMPRIVLAEFNTHRRLSRNSASSRAIPVSKQIAMVLDDPFVPAKFPLNQPGMSAAQYLEPGDPAFDVEVTQWLADRDHAVESTRARAARGIHKQIANRILEPFMWHEAIVSGTEWGNFLALRAHPEAQPEIQEPAEAMRDAIGASTPTPRAQGEWHLPLTGFEGDDQLGLGDLIKVSIGRCARVSYLTHFGTRDPQADITLFDRLQESRHLSPFEHAAQSMPGAWANFDGWRQARWFLEQGLPLPA